MCLKSLLILNLPGIQRNWMCIRPTTSKMTWYVVYKGVKITRIIVLIKFKLLLFMYTKRKYNLNAQHVFN